jgi:hypothetical protein
MFHSLVSWGLVGAAMLESCGMVLVSLGITAVVVGSEVEQAARWVFR